MRADEKRERIEGVRVPCRDAKRRVWQAMDLLEREQLRRSRPHSVVSRPKPASREDRDRAAGT
jgi:hypothetical protein